MCRIDEPAHFCGGCPPRTPQNEMHSAALEGCTGGGSVTELVCGEHTRFNLPTQNSEEAFFAMICRKEGWLQRHNVLFLSYTPGQDVVADFPYFHFFFGRVSRQYRGTDPGIISNPGEQCCVWFNESWRSYVHSCIHLLPQILLRMPGSSIESRFTQRLPLWENILAGMTHSTSILPNNA